MRSLISSNLSRNVEKYVYTSNARGYSFLIAKNHPMNNMCFYKNNNSSHNISSPNNINKYCTSNINKNIIVRNFSDNTTSSSSSSSTNNEENKNSETLDNVEDGAEETTKEESETTIETDPMQEKIIKLENEVKELKEKIIRSYAEEENVRRIAKRDVLQAKQYSNISFAKSLLDVADNLELALTTTATTSSTDCENNLKILIEGVEMTNTGLLKVFSQNGIEKYGEVGDIFDPNLHDAIFNLPDPEKKLEAGSIGQVIKKGYKMKDRIIRAAQVGTVQH